MQDTNFGNGHQISILEERERAGGSRSLRAAYEGNIEGLSVRTGRAFRLPNPPRDRCRYRDRCRPDGNLDYDYDHDYDDEAFSVGSEAPFPAPHGAAYNLAEGAPGFWLLD